MSASRQINKYHHTAQPLQPYLTTSRHMAAPCPPKATTNRSQSLPHWPPQQRTRTTVLTQPLTASTPWIPTQHPPATRPSTSPPPTAAQVPPKPQRLPQDLQQRINTPPCLTNTNEASNNYQTYSTHSARRQHRTPTPCLWKGPVTLCHTRHRSPHQPPPPSDQQPAAGPPVEHHGS